MLAQRACPQKVLALAHYIFSDINHPNFAFSCRLFVSGIYPFTFIHCILKIYVQRNLVFNFREILYVYLRLPTSISFVHLNVQLLA